LIFDYDGIELMKIHAKMPGEVLIKYQDHWRGIRAGSDSNNALFQHLLDLAFHLIFLSWIEPVRAQIDLCSTQEQGNSMVELAWRWELGGFQK
jgi:hypothetical protein